MQWQNWQREYHPAGSTIFSEGEMGSTAYLIESGQIVITMAHGDSVREIALLNCGAVVGEIALIGQCKRTASAIALDDVTLIPITREMVERKLQDADPLLCHLLDLVVDRYRALADERLPRSQGLVASVRPGLSLNAAAVQEFAIGQIKLAQDLNDAIASESFKLYYQPIIAISESRIAGFEALIRWQRPGHGMVPPLDFLALAENIGLIIPLGRWVIEEACRGLAQLQASLEQSNPLALPLFMSINMSPMQLQEQGEVDEVMARIRQSTPHPERIKLEITETAIIRDPQKAAEALHRLKQIGLRLAIDDFGTGYSSLSYLDRLPFDTLKIDRSFVTAMNNGTGGQRIVRALIQLARELQMECIAEGVESVYELDQLRQFGCEYVQGYHYSRPLALADACQFIQQWQGA
jgi:diguanylate cyclase